MVRVELIIILGFCFQNNLKDEYEGVMGVGALAHARASADKPSTNNLSNGKAGTTGRKLSNHKLVRPV